jgi:hypothetical protein
MFSTVEGKGGSQFGIGSPQFEQIALVGNEYSS